MHPETAPISDFPISSHSTKNLIAREILACTAATLLYPLGWIKSQRRTTRSSAQRTVVLVHGYGGNSSSFTALRGYFKLIGVPQVLVYNYRLTDSIERAAIGLKAFLQERVRGGRIDLVCHSLGGLISKLYIQELGGARRIDHCVTLGTPHQGTYNAYWVVGRVGRDLRPDSPLLARLRANEKKNAPVKTTAIVGESDNIVIPRVFAGTGTETIVVSKTGHLGILFSPTAMRSVARVLGY